MTDEPKERTISDLEPGDMVWVVRDSRRPVNEWHRVVRISPNGVIIDLNGMDWLMFPDELDLTKPGPSEETSPVRPTAGDVVMITCPVRDAPAGTVGVVHVAGELVATIRFVGFMGTRPVPYANLNWLPMPELLEVGAE